MSTRFDIQRGLEKAINRLDLTRTEMITVMRQIMTGEVGDIQMAAFLVALRMKSESLDEIVGAVKVMRELSTKVDVSGVSNLVDIVGTGGDGANLFNVSSASAYVAAAAGCAVAKHGSRSVSSNSGSADLLERAGVKLDVNAEQVAQCVKEVGLGFMFAPSHHGAMQHAIHVRKALSQRTIFNILGPMTNPAGVQNLVIGVFNKALCRPMAEALAALGAEHLLIVHGEDGLDEISLATATYVVELKNGEIKEYTVTPEQLGVESASLVGLVIDAVEQSYDLIMGAFGDDSVSLEPKYIEKARNMIALNAGAAIYVAGVESSWNAGVAKALTVMKEGKALEKVQELAKFCESMKGPDC